METSHELEVSSVVTDTTQESEGTNQEFQAMWKGLYGYTETVPDKLIDRVYCTPVPESIATEIENSESPLFPVQQLNKLNIIVNNQTSREASRGTIVQGIDGAGDGKRDDDSMSELSQPLIPLLSKAREQTPHRRKPSVEMKEDYLAEASQSLLPQTAAERGRLPDALGKIRQNSKNAVPVSSSLNSCATGFKPFPIPGHRETGCTDVKQEEKVSGTQSTTSSKGDNPVWGSQREIIQSQGAATAADKISARLERLVESLSTATRKQKRVMEIAVNQCVGKLQDNINHRLKNRNLSLDQQETMKKILRTTQSCISRLLEHHRAEKLLLPDMKTSRRADSMQKIPTSDPSQQSTLEELRQRQKELQSLLKRQQNLLDRFKELLRNQPSTQASVVSGNSSEGKSSTKHKETGKGNPQSIGRPGKHPERNSSAEESYLTSEQTMQNQSSNLVSSGSSRGGKGKSTENVIRTRQNPDNMQKIGDGAANYQVNIDDMPEPSQDLTTVPDTQEPYSQMTDKTIDQPVKFDREAEKIVEDLGMATRSQTCTGTVQERVPVRSTRIPKRNIPWSPDQDGSQRPKNKKSDKPETAADDGPLASHSEMLWLKMLHHNKDTLAKSPFDKVCDGKGTITEKSAIISEKTTVQPKGMTDAKEVLVDNLPDVQRKFDFIHKKDFPNETEKMNDSDDARKLTSDSVPTNKSDAQQPDQDIPEILKCNKGNFHANENFLKPPGFTSPPQLCVDHDISTNVSPTATSMSSDVFLVKAKELNRRMKMRARLAEKYVGITKIPPADNELNVDLKSREVEPCNTTRPVEDNEKDTVAEAIASVIVKSRNITGVAKQTDTGDTILGHHRENAANSSNIAAPVLAGMAAISNSTKEPVHVKQYWAEIQDKGKMAVTGSQKLLEEKRNSSVLPSLKQLLHSGIITPGKNSLAVFVQGVLHKATLTPLGKIRTSQGLVLTSPMQWLSTLTDGEPKKKRSTYAQTLYKGRSLLDICTKQNRITGPDNRKTFLDQKVENPSKSDEPLYRSHENHNLGQVSDCTPAQKSEKAVQADMDYSLKTSLGNGRKEKQMSEAEVWLNKLLSTSVVRLLSDQDLVSGDDLPDNFWTEDYSKVRLSVDIWDTVDKW